MASMSVFQTEGEGSNPLSRSKAQVETIYTCISPPDGKYGISTGEMQMRPRKLVTTVIKHNDGSQLNRSVGDRRNHYVA